jgi:hypothetical protein
LLGKILEKHGEKVFIYPADSFKRSIGSQDEGETFQNTQTKERSLSTIIRREISPSIS